MSATITIPAVPLEFLNLRVFIWKEDDQYAAQCLETGSVATADDFHTLRNMIYTVLVNEYDYNIIGDGSLRNLLGTPAPLEVWHRYYELSKNRNADLVSGIVMLDGSF